MKKTLLLFASFFCATILKAGIDPTVGIDLTPARYVFANQPVGPYVIDAISPDWNVPGGWPNAEVPYNNGLLAYSGDFGSSKQLAKYYGDGLSIVDLGGEVGKVLCLKGFDVSDAVFPYGLKPSNKDGIGQNSYFHLNFYSPIEPDKKLLINKTFTIRTVFKIITDTPNDAKPIWEWHWRTPKTGELWTSSQLYSAMFEEEGKDSWCVVEMTCNPGDPTSGHFPITLKTASDPALLLNAAILIKEMSFIADTKVAGATKEKPVVTTDFIKLEMDPVGNSKNEMSANCSVVDGKLKIKNLQGGERISIYSLSGVLLKEMIATNTAEVISLDKGFFTIKVNSSTYKIII